MLLLLLFWNNTLLNDICCLPATSMHVQDRLYSLYNSLAFHSFSQPTGMICAFCYDEDSLSRVHACPNLTWTKQHISKLSLPVHSSVTEKNNNMALTWWRATHSDNLCLRICLLGQARARRWGRSDLGLSPDAQEADPPGWHHINCPCSKGCWWMLVLYPTLTSHR